MTPAHSTGPLQIVVGGAAGSGKSTQAARLAAALGARLIEADGFHPPANVAKMAAGIPLTDEDRAPWLDLLRGELERDAESGTSSVLACSALTEAYRERLRPRHGVFLVCMLMLPEAALGHRVAARPGHFMPATLVHSQVQTLEPLTDTEPGFAVVADGSEDDVFAKIVEGLDRFRTAQH